VAGESERGQGLGTEDADFERLRTGRRPRSIDEATLVGDADHARSVGLGDVVHPDEPGQLDGRADLLPAFANGRERRVLVIVDESTWQAPEPVARLDRPSPQDDPTV
jgi:hypothetical protein